MGGFSLAKAIEKWNLHKRIALQIINFIGSNSTYIILGFMISTAIISMWISNTATAVMMLTIGLSIVYQLNKNLLAKFYNLVIFAVQFRNYKF